MDSSDFEIRDDSPQGICNNFIEVNGRKDEVPLHLTSPRTRGQEVPEETIETTTIEIECAWGGCTLSFDSLQALTTHLLDEHVGQRKKSYKCNWRGCSERGKPLANRFQLIAHLRKHSGDRPYLCPADGCDKSYKRPDALSKHLRLHCQGGSSLKNNNGSSRKPIQHIATRSTKSRLGSPSSDDTLSSDDAPLALVSAASGRCSEIGGHKPTAVLSIDYSDKDPNPDELSDGSDTKDCPPEQLIPLLEAQLAYIHKEVESREHQLAAIKNKTRRLCIENDIIIDNIMQL